MNTDLKQLVVGSLVSIVGIATGNTFLATTAGAAGVNWASEGFANLVLKRKPEPANAELLAVAKHAFVAALNQLEAEVRTKQRAEGGTADAAAQSFALLREATSAFVTGGLGPPPDDAQHAQTVLEHTLDQWLHGHDPQVIDLLKRRLAAEMSQQFLLLLTHDEHQAAYRYFLTQQIRELARYPTHQAHFAQINARLDMLNIYDQQRETALKEAIAQLEATIAALLPAPSAAEVAAIVNRNVEVKGDADQVAGDRHENTLQLGTLSPAPPPSNRPAIINDGLRVGGKLEQTGGNKYSNSTIVGHDANLTINNGPPLNLPQLRPQAVPVSSVPRPPLDATLSSDGVHFRAGYALLIGIATYDDPTLKVADDTSVNDVLALEALLRDPQRAGYQSEQVMRLTDQRATHTAILTALDDLAQRVTTDATVLIFFAGHGERFPDQGYGLLPYDVSWHNLAATSLNQVLLAEKIAAIKAKAARVVIILNCCHAAGIGGQVLAAEPVLSGTPPPAAFYRALSTGTGSVVISASRPEQKAAARSPHQPSLSLFGARLIEAFERAAVPDDPAIRISGLFGYLSRHVPRDAQKVMYRGQPLQQHPLLDARDSEDFALALRPVELPPTSVLGAESAALYPQWLSAEIALAQYDPPSSAPRDLRQTVAALRQALGMPS